MCKLSDIGLCLSQKAILHRDTSLITINGNNEINLHNQVKLRLIIITSDHSVLNCLNSSRVLAVYSNVPLNSAGCPEGSGSKWLQHGLK